MKQHHFWYYRFPFWPWCLCWRRIVSSDFSINVSVTCCCVCVRCYFHHFPWGWGIVIYLIIFRKNLFHSFFFFPPCFLTPSSWSAGQTCAEVFECQHYIFIMAHCTAFCSLSPLLITLIIAFWTLLKFWNSPEILTVLYIIPKSPSWLVVVGLHNHFLWKVISVLPFPITPYYFTFVFFWI